MDSTLSGHLGTVPPLSAMDSSSVTGSGGEPTSLPTPASSFKPQEDGSHSKHEQEKDATGLGGDVHTTCPPSGDSALLASQIQKLHDRLAEIEKKIEKDRLGKGGLQDTHCQDSGFAEDEAILGPHYISNALKVLEREILLLKEDQKSLNDLWKTRQTLKEKRKGRDQEKNLLLKNQTGQEGELKASALDVQSERNCTRVSGDGRGNKSSGPAGALKHLPIEKLHEDPITLEATSIDPYFSIPRAGKPTVMISPYKALIYYGDAIRDTYHSLKLKLGIQNVKDPRLNETRQLPEPKGGESPIPSLFDAPGHNASTYNVAESENEKDGSEEVRDAFTTSRAAYEHLQCLIDFMDDDIKKKLESLVNCQTITFSDLWYLFKPGEEVICRNQRQVYRILHIVNPVSRRAPPGLDVHNKAMLQYKKEEYSILLTCVHLNFDGDSLGAVHREVRIYKFDGNKPVTSLEVFPLRFADRGSKEPGEATLRQKLIARGKVFLSMTSFEHMHYSGWTLDTKDEVDGDIVVDFQEAFAAEENRDDSWRPRVTHTIYSNLGKDSKPTTSSCYGEDFYSDFHVDHKRNKDYRVSLEPGDRRPRYSPILIPHSLNSIPDLETEFPDEDLLIMSYRVFGFILRSRKWAQFDLAHLSLPQTSSILGKTEPPSVNTLVEGGIDRSDHGPAQTSDTTHLDQVRRNETAFNQLVLPPGHKEMVESLVAQHFRDKYCPKKQVKDDRQFDIVRGKGKGLIILLHGAPGVGKTSTAALALAEYRAQGDRSKQVVDADAVVHLTKQDLEIVSKAYEHFILYVNEVRGQDSSRYAKSQKLRAREIDILPSVHDTHNVSQNAAAPVASLILPTSIAANPQPMHPAPASVSYGYPQYNAVGAMPPGYPYPYYPLSVHPQAPTQGQSIYGAQPAVQQGHPPDATATWSGQQQQSQLPPQQYHQYQQPPPQGTPSGPNFATNQM